MNTSMKYDTHDYSIQLIKKYFLNKKNGFTLIELVIVSAILMVVTGGALSNFQGFNDKQKVKQEVANLKSNLLAIQTKAVNGEKPDLTDPSCSPPNDCTCTKLTGYSVTFSGSNYSSQALCNNGSGDVLVGPSKSIDISSSLSISPVPTSPLIFNSFTKGLSSAQSLTIVGQSSSETITISKNGLIDAVTPTPTSSPIASPTNTPTPTPVPTGDGLTGEYYDARDLTNLVGTQIDPIINFDWGSGKPSFMTGNNTFSIRWTGYVLTTTAGTYRFFVDADDGERLWINNTQIIAKWNNSGEYHADIDLAANQKYAIKLEYNDDLGTANVTLKWKLLPGGSKVVIPQANLFTYP